MCAVRPRSTVNLLRFGSRLNSSSETAEEFKREPNRSKFTVHSSSETAVCRPAQSAGENFENPSQSLWLILSHANLRDCAVSVSSTDLSGFEMNIASSSG